MIDKITLTGADQKTYVGDLCELSKRCPFVEWGILLSKSSMGAHPRFPSRQWLALLAAFKKHASQITGECIPLSGHLCGRWVRDLCKGEWTFLKELGSDIVGMFNRIQLNFRAEVHKLDHDKFIRGFTEGSGRKYSKGRQFIFQLDDVNNGILDIAKEAGVDAVPLFDLSGGAGILPENWPVADGYCGYAGGLSPENVEEQLELIREAAGDSSFWIDAETKLRSEDDRVFDLDKCEEFIKNVLIWKWSERETRDQPVSPPVHSPGLMPAPRFDPLSHRPQLDEDKDDVS